MFCLASRLFVVSRIEVPMSEGEPGKMDTNQPSYIETPLTPGADTYCILFSFFGLHEVNNRSGDFLTIYVLLIYSYMPVGS